MEIVSIFLSEVNGCPRGRRISTLLKKGHSMFVYSYGKSRLEHFEHSQIPDEKGGFLVKIKLFLYLLTGNYISYLNFKNFSKLEFAKKPAKIVICHDALLLPSIVDNKAFKKVIFDAREFYPGQFEHDWLWKLTFGRLYHWICLNYLHKIDEKITVSGSIAILYEKQYGAKFSVLPSYPEYHELTIKEMEPGMVHMVHHGVANRNRSIEAMITMVDLLPENYRLDLYLVPIDKRYYRKLCKLTESIGRVTMHHPVQPEDIITTINNYDIGLFVPPPVTVNLNASLPNKFFEYIQARLAIVVSPLDEVSKWVKKYDVGKVSSGFSAEEIADTILQMDEEATMYYKKQSNKHAKELSMLSLEKEINELVNFS